MKTKDATDIQTAIDNVKHYRVKNLKMLRELTIDRLQDYTLTDTERTRHTRFLEALEALIKSKEARP